MEKKEEPLSKALKEKIKARVADVASVGNLVPCVIIIHLIPDFSVQYISEIGLAFLDRTNDE